MTSLNLGIESRRPEIVDIAHRCRETLQQCLLKASAIHPREFSKVEDQIARFRTWSTTIGIFALGRASADHRLRYAPDVQTVIVGLLESLYYRARICSDILDPPATPPRSEKLGSIDEALARVLHDIATELGHLSKISNLIRRASKEARDVRGSDFQIMNDDGDNVESLLSHQFAHYIQDRFPSISDTLLQRLCRTMLLRRKRILYRRHRQQELAAQPHQAVSGPSIISSVTEMIETMAQTNPQEIEYPSPEIVVTKIAPSQFKSATTLLPNKFNIAAASPSVVSASKTMPLDRDETLRFPPAPGTVVKRKFEQLKKQRLAAHQPTNTANIDGNSSSSDINIETDSLSAKLKEALELELQTLGDVTCPYCLDALPPTQVIEERRWRDHVLSDLDPYICFMEDCAQPDELYTHSDAWICHLRQHGQYWHCLSHQESGLFSAREDYIRHLRDQHKLKLDDTKLRVLANGNAQDMVDALRSCPLCGSDDNMIGGRLLGHITGHLRSLALISLPSYHEDVSGEVASEERSLHISQPLSRSAVEDLNDDEATPFLDDGRPENNELASRNFLGCVHHHWDAERQDVWGASMTIDDMKARAPTESTDNDPILRSILQRQGGFPEAFFHTPVSHMTLEQFLEDRPKLYWMHRDGTKGHAVGNDYEPMQWPTSGFDVLSNSSESYTQQFKLLTADNQGVYVVAKIALRRVDPSRLRDEFNILRSLRHKHVSAVIGNFSLRLKHQESQLGYLMIPLAKGTLNDLLEDISRHNTVYQALRGAGWSPHYYTHKFLPYFACLCDTVLFLHKQDRPIRHGNINPTSILIENSDNVVLDGFWISRAFDSAQEAITYGSLDGDAMYSSKSVWTEVARNNPKSSSRGLERDVISLGFVFLEMATVLFGKNLVEMRALMTTPPLLETVSYAESLAEGKIKQWLDSLGRTAATTPWKAPQQFVHMTQVDPDYAQKFLDAIEGMISAGLNDNRPLERAWRVFGCLSTHCPSP